MLASPVTAASTRAQLAKILSSSLFANSERSRALLRFVVEQTLEQQTERLKEYTLGTEALGRGASFDPRTDPIVRAEVSRLRTRLEHYYAAEGRADPVEIVLPRGTYIPQFVDRGPTEESIDVAKSRPAVTGELRPLGGGIIAVAAFAAGLAVALGGTVIYFKARVVPAPSQVVQFVIQPPPNSIFAAPISRQPFAISPDGTRLALTATGPTGTHIWIRDLASLEMRQIPGSEGAWGMFWSPDSQSVLFSVNGTLKQANLANGSTQLIAHIPFHVISAAWRSPGEMFLNVGSETYEVLAESGEVRKLPGQEMRWAQFLPKSDRYLRVRFTPRLGRYQAVVTDFTTQKSTPLMEVDSRVQYAPPRLSGDVGSLVFVRRGVLLAQGFDAERLRLIGNPIPIAQNIVTFGPTASACFSVSDNGVLVYQAGYPLSELRWYDRQGRVDSTAVHPASFTGNVRALRGDKRGDKNSVVATQWNFETGGTDIWIFDQNGRENRQLTYSSGSHIRPVWSPNGGSIMFGGSLTIGPRLKMIERAPGATEHFLNEALKLPAVAELQIPTDWSSDGKWILYDTSLGEENRQVWLADATTGATTPFLQGDSSQWGAAFSPDGTQVAFISDQSGRPEVYVQSVGSTPVPQLVGERHRVSHDGGWLVRWRADGRELFYAGVDARLYAMSMEHDVATGQAKALFEIPGRPQYGTATDFQFDVQADGQRFVMTTAASAAPPPFTVIQNWQETFHR